MSGGTFDTLEYQLEEAITKIKAELKINKLTVQENWDSFSDEEKERSTEWERPWSMAPGKTPWWVDDEARKVADKELGLKDGDFSKLSDVAKKRWCDIRFEALRKLVDEHNSSPLGYSYSDETVAKIKEMLKTIELSKIYIHRLDWLFSGDDGQDQFLKRTEKEVNELNAQGIY